MAVDTSWIVPSSDLPTPRAIISRQDLWSKIDEALVKHGRVTWPVSKGLNSPWTSYGYATLILPDRDSGKVALCHAGIVFARVPFRVPVEAGLPGWSIPERKMLAGI